MNVYKVTHGSKPLSIVEKEAILVSELNLSNLQGVRDALGIKATLIGSNGREIQIYEDVPRYTEFASIDEAVKSVNENR